ncbi:hypothetical protein ACFV5L_10945, partial [Streptomyces sp. NPDC059761]
MSESATKTRTAARTAAGPPAGLATPNRTETYELALTTQGPLYPPSEVMDGEGNFVVVGMVNRPTATGGGGGARGGGRGWPPAHRAPGGPR